MGPTKSLQPFSSFHGRSLALTAASGQPAMHTPFETLPAGFINVKNNDIDAIKQATTDMTCAVLLEPVQAEGAASISPTKTFCKKYATGVTARAC
jgi:acetylornithine/succinyldiaminopimelate/putrescine aminotransferase